jgi:hypothetical protein
VDDLHPGPAEIKDHPILQEKVDPAGLEMAFLLNIGMPFFMLRLRHIAITVNQGVETGKVGSVLQMGAESGTGEKIIENQVIFVGVRVEQIIHGPLVPEGGQLVLVAGGIDDRPAPVVD